MTKRDVVLTALRGEKPPYVPWDFSLTSGAYDNLREHFGYEDNDSVTNLFENHLNCFWGGGSPEYLGNDIYRDTFGAEWDRSVDKDIGAIQNPQLSKPTLEGYSFPDPNGPRFFKNAEAAAKNKERFSIYCISFSLYERAWSLRGMETLMMDFYDEPEFVHELFNAITEHNLVRVRKAINLGFDAIYFGDDWGQQTGLQMGPALWNEFIRPCVSKMYKTVRDAGRQVFIHSCGAVDELFDDLVELGVNCFNPFQPEVMDVYSLLPQYRGRLAFYGGLSTQKTLPYQSEEEVRTECRRLLELGRDGGYIFSPAHAVESDVPVENILAFIEEAKNQPGFAS